ncbi:MAG: 4Fe-4S dicluster domain-containing protein [Bacteroidales bacterium]|nr:4Fe-4S dicluster domain-containing protein [Bacteroidales bacterium]MBN2762723.1 4Fe-4S dicluster domain-containing protein [Bacteroidales bacterium]
MKYPKLREIGEALVSLFSPAYTTKFPARPHVPFENFRGKPVVDDANCVGCETCANVCPTGAITFRDDVKNKTRTIERNYGLCIFCGQCQEHCITQKGVKLSDKIYDMATFNRGNLIEKQEKELIICRSCGAVITTKEHVHFIHDKLGSAAYSSLLSLNMLNEKLKLADEESISVEVTDGLKRKDMFNIICPNCLRKVLIKSL